MRWRSSLTVAMTLRATRRYVSLTSMANLLSSYLAATPAADVTAPMAGYVAALDQVYDAAPEVAAAVVQELADQRAHLKLIASENYASLAVQAAMGNLLTDKYAEGVPGHRFYAGCTNVDAVERRAARLACELFGAEHAYVQPHSGADANLVAYWAILATRVEQPRLAALDAKSPLALSAAHWERLRGELGNQRLLGMDLGAGGHLTHGYRLNASGRMFECHSYGVDADSGRIDYEALARRTRQIQPLILLAGYSSYPRAIDFRRMRAIADAVGAVLMVDMAHFAGLIAGGALSGDYDPVPFADVVTSPTHKTLRGARGGLVLCRAEFAEAVDRGCPLVLGGPLPQMLAAKAVAFAEASGPDFARYARQVVANAQALAAACADCGLAVVTGGTDNHLLVLDVTPCGLTGRQAESALRDAGIMANRNAIPGDRNGPWYTSGLRIGTPALTTLGMAEEQMRPVAAWIARVLEAAEPAVITRGPRAGNASRSRYRLPDAVRSEVGAGVARLLQNFPAYPGLDLSVLQKLMAGAGEVAATG